MPDEAIFRTVDHEDIARNGSLTARVYRPLSDRTVWEWAVTTPIGTVRARGQRSTLTAARSDAAASIGLRYAPDDLQPLEAA